MMLSADKSGNSVQLTFAISRDLHDFLFYSLSNLKYAATLDFGKINTNWKFLIENFIEPYHVQFVHKTTTNQPLKDHYTFVDGKCYGSGIDVENEDDRFMALANTRARLRMTSLYYFAGLNNFLVAGTGNKVEDFGVGFYTKYGDGGVDVSPIADLMKSEVYAVANYLKINEEIQTAAPTDGLWGDDRTDEDQLGASYDELEWAMIKQKEGVHSDVFSGRKKEVYEIYLKLNMVQMEQKV